MIPFDEVLPLHGIEDLQTLLALFDLFDEVRSALGVLTMLRDTVTIEVISQIKHEIRLIRLRDRRQELPRSLVMIRGMCVGNNQPLEEAIGREYVFCVELFELDACSASACDFQSGPPFAVDIPAFYQLSP